MSNEVYIVPYDKTQDIKEGFDKQVHKQSIWNKYNDIGRYMDKSLIKNNPVFQEIIPYIIIRNQDNCYLTASLKTESKTIISMGFGDNIIPQDGTSQPLFKGAVRTLFEDVMLQVLTPMQFIGTIKDVSHPTKIGYVFLIDSVETDSVDLKNKTLFKRWMSIDDLVNSYGRLESWSKLLVDYLVVKPI